MKKTRIKKVLVVGIILLFIAIAYVPVLQGFTNDKSTLPSNMMFTATPTQMNEKPAVFEWGVDQKNTQNSGFGITLHPPETHAQSFTPTKNKLTAVSLYLFKGVTPPEPVHITVSIRDQLDGLNLATHTINTSEVTITKSGGWILFDFGDLTIIPQSTYYLLCSADAGSPSNAYCWLFANNDTYPRGEAWFQDNETSPWVHWPSGSMYPVDFCFKTYFRKPFDSFILENHQQLPTSRPDLTNLQSSRVPPSSNTPLISYVDALGFLNGRMTNCTYQGGYLQFHAQHVFFLALAPYGCSIVWLFLNKDVRMPLCSIPLGIIGIQRIHIVFKTKVSGPI
jgi:hypothetical protein